jgi:hypothetical protein
MNRNKKPTNKGKYIYLNACLLPTVLSKDHFPKLVFLATPGILYGSAVWFASHIVFAIIGSLLTGKKYLMWSIREID